MAAEWAARWCLYAARIAWDRSCRGWLSLSRRLESAESVCGNEHVASTPMAGEPRRVAAGRACARKPWKRCLRPGCRRFHHAGPATAGPAMPGVRHPGRARAQRLITGALLCAIAVVCTILALNGQLTLAKHLIGVRTAGSTAPQANTIGSAPPAAQPLVDARRRRASILEALLRRGKHLGGGFARRGPAPHRRPPAAMPA